MRPGFIGINQSKPSTPCKGVTRAINTQRSTLNFPPGRWLAGSPPPPCRTARGRAGCGWKSSCCHDHGLVDPHAACVFQVVFDAERAGHAFALENFRRDRNRAAVAENELCSVKKPIPYQFLPNNSDSVACGRQGVKLEFESVFGEIASCEKVFAFSKQPGKQYVKQSIRTNRCLANSRFLTTKF